MQDLQNLSQQTGVKATGSAGVASLNNSGAVLGISPVTGTNVSTAYNRPGPVIAAPPPDFLHAYFPFIVAGLLIVIIGLLVVTVICARRSVRTSSRSA